MGVRVRRVEVPEGLVKRFVQDFGSFLSPSECIGGSLGLTTCWVVAL